MCREIVKVAKLLANKRDMGLNELKLTVAVEDPRVKERRAMGIEVTTPSASPLCHLVEVTRTMNVTVHFPLVSDML